MGTRPRQKVSQATFGMQTGIGVQICVFKVLKLKECKIVRILVFKTGAAAETIGKRGCGKDSVAFWRRIPVGGLSSIFERKMGVQTARCSCERLPPKFPEASVHAAWSQPPGCMIIYVHVYICVHVYLYCEGHGAAAGCLVRP